MSLPQIWHAFQSVHLTHQGLGTLLPQFDNPFLIQYVVYHHYRSLGWVVKGGIKFCVDYLLYKRGPVFSHAEWVTPLLSPFFFNSRSCIFRFAIVVCPVYEDPEDQAASSLDLQNSSPCAWSWLSTINRVNSQVQKACTPTLCSQKFGEPSTISTDSDPHICDDSCPLTAFPRHFLFPGLPGTLFCQRSDTTPIYSRTDAGLTWMKIFNILFQYIIVQHVHPNDLTMSLRQCGSS